MYGAFERKEMWYLKIERKNHIDVILPLKMIKNPPKFENQELHYWFLETLFWFIMPGEKLIQTANISGLNGLNHPGFNRLVKTR